MFKLSLLVSGHTIKSINYFKKGKKIRISNLLGISGTPPLQKLINEKFSEETMALQVRYRSRYNYNLQYNSKNMTNCHTITITQLKIFIGYIYTV